MVQLSSLFKEQAKPTHIISYDLDYPYSPSTYQAIDKKIKSLGLWSKPLNTFWLINTSLDCETIKNSILPEILNRGRLLIVNTATGARSSYGLAAGELVLKLRVPVNNEPRIIPLKPKLSSLL